MKIILNNQVVHTNTTTLTGVLEEQSLIHKTGIAVAVNNQVIKNTLWQQKYLQENDQILIITAISGG